MKQEWKKDVYEASRAEKTTGEEATDPNHPAPESLQGIYESRMQRQHDTPGDEETGDSETSP